MGQSKRVRFSVRREYLVEIDENELVRLRVHFRDQYPEGKWDDDASVVNALVEDYQCSGDHDDYVIGPWVTVLESSTSNLTRP
jgi:hypothetical protein